MKSIILEAALDQIFISLLSVWNKIRLTKLFNSKVNNNTTKNVQVKFYRDEMGE